MDYDQGCGVVAKCRLDNFARVGCGAVVMRPLLHSSSKATQLLPRRALHFVFGPPKLPLGLTWQNAV
jgi:hypothetical protein